MIQRLKLCFASLALAATMFTALPPLLLTTLVVTQTACPKVDTNELAGYGQDVVSALNDALPILSNGGIGTGKIQTAISIGGQLVTAFKNNDGSALDLTAKLITAFEDIANDAGLIKDPATRTRFLTVLALGNIALHYIANHSKGAGTIARGRRGGETSLATIEDFRAKKKWRCRSSQSGRFEQMEFCAQHPDVSQVEVY